jgi:hypothetical protein
VWTRGCGLCRGLGVLSAVAGVGTASIAGARIGGHTTLEPGRQGVDVDLHVLSLSVPVAFVLGVAVSLVVAPDPTGVLPVVLSVVLTGLSIPICYYGLGRVLAPDEQPR